MKFVFKLPIALVSGIGLSFTQAPYDLWFLIFPCFSVFYYLYASSENKKQAFAISFIFALGYFIAGLHWIGNALLVEGNDYKWAWPIAVMALPALLSLFPAIYLTINHILFKKNALIKFMGFCLFLSLSEWVRGYAFTGFPWNLYGYGAASNLALAQSLSIVGPYGLTFLTVLWGSFVGGWAIKQNHRASVSVLIILSFVLTYLYGAQRLKNADVQYDDDVQVHLVQPNIPQAEKWKTENLSQNFLKHLELLKTPLGSNKKHVVVWPETALPPILLSSGAVQQRLRNMLGGNALLLSGALVMEPEASDIGYYNALLAWTATKDGERVYSKSHLVPFGEYIPFQKYIPIPTVTKFSGFKRGGGVKAIELEGYPSFSPLICYEIIFPHQVVNNDAPRPDYILTVTNDAWYGDSAGPYQHFAQSRFRAIENGLPVLRSANTGISGMIDPYGRIIQKISLSTEGSIDISLPKGLLEPTLYSQRQDSLFLVFLSICLFLCTFFQKRAFYREKKGN